MPHPAKLREVRRKRRLAYGCALEDRAITMKTRIRYYNAIQKLLKEVELAGNPDKVISEWIQKQFEDGESITVISDAFCGLQHYCTGLKNQLGNSWRLFKVWRRVEKSQQAPPLPLGFLQALVGRALEVQDLELATCLTVGFWGMLRTGELLSLVPQQLLLGRHDLVVRLGLTKTGLRQAVDENVLITDECTWLICETFLRLRRLAGTANHPVWTRGTPAFRQAFAELIAFFQLNPSFKPYSLRRGGATHDFRSHGLMEHTLLRGRWATTTAARQYVQEGLSALTEIRINAHTYKLLKQYKTILQ